MNVATSQKRKAIGYRRVSTDHQENQRQEEGILETAEEFNLEIVETVQLDGVSGSDVEQNAEYQEMFHKLERHPEYAGIVADAVDRIIRPQKFRHFGVFDQVADLNKIIWTKREGECDPNTDEGFNKLITAAHAAGNEKREFRRRSMNGKRKNAKKGNLNSGSVPFGYTYVYADKRTRSRGSMIINEQQAEIVRMMFTWALNGDGVYEIAKKLNLRNIPSPMAGKIANKTGQPCSGKWDQAVVWGTFQHETYCGWIEYGKGTPDAIRTFNPALAIVDEATFYAVRLAMQGRRDERARRGRPSRKYELTGLVWCAYCGHRIGSETRNRGRAGAYRCKHIDPAPPRKRLCDAPSIEKLYLETEVKQKLWDTVTDPDILCPMIEHAFGDMSPGPNPRIAELEAAIGSLRGAEETAYLNMQEPRLKDIRSRTITDWEKARRARTDAEIELAQLQRQATSQQAPSKEAVQEMARLLAATKPQTFEEWQQWLKLLVTEIRISADEAVIQTIIPESILAGAGGEGKGNQKSYSRIQGNRIFDRPFSSPPVNRPISFQINVKLR